MRGKQRREQDLFCYVQLENLVPQDHILRKIKAEIDFSFIDELTEPLYSNKGRPSIDPQVLVRMLLIGYLYGINGERRLCREVHLNIAYRWFCDLSLEDKVPDHSSFSKNRHGRFQDTNFFNDHAHIFSGSATPPICLPPVIHPPCNFIPIVELKSLQYFYILELNTIIARNYK